MKKLFASLALGLSLCFGGAAFAQTAPAAAAAAGQTLPPDVVSEWPNLRSVGTARRTCGARVEHGRTKCGCGGALAEADVGGGADRADVAAATRGRVRRGGFATGGVLRRGMV